VLDSGIKALATSLELCRSQTERPYACFKGTGKKPVLLVCDSAPPLKKGGFLQATFEELKLVVWPSRQQLFSESIAVILMVSLSAAAIAALSRFYGWAASQVFR